MLHSKKLRAGVVALGFSISAAAVAAEPPAGASAASKSACPARITSKVDAQPVGALTDEESKEVSFAAGRILKHVAQARSALREGKNDAASTHVAQARKLVAIIDSVLPRTRVRAEIRSGDLVYTDDEEVAPRYVRLFDELERRDIIAPIAQARQESDRKHPAPDAEEPAAAEDRGAFAVRHAGLVYSTARLDLEMARALLNRAKQELGADKHEAADETLLALESDGVLFEYEEMDLPLEEVADNLKLAESELQTGHPAEARAALHVAMDDLKRYAMLVGENRSAEVRALNREIDAVAEALGRDILSEAQRHQYAARIAEWWQRSTKWLRGTQK